MCLHANSAPPGTAETLDALRDSDSVYSRTPRPTHTRRFGLRYLRVTSLRQTLPRATTPSASARTVASVHERSGSRRRRTHAPTPEKDTTGKTVVHAFGLALVAAAACETPSRPSPDT